MRSRSDKRKPGTKPLHRFIVERSSIKNFSHVISYLKEPSSADYCGFLFTSKYLSEATFVNFSILFMWLFQKKTNLKMISKFLRFSPRVIRRSLLVLKAPHRWISANDNIFLHSNFLMIWCVWIRMYNSLKTTALSNLLTRFPGPQPKILLNTTTACR